MDKIDINYAKNVMSYDPETGVFTWIKAPSGNSKVGGIVGSLREDGYIVIKVNSVCISAHRLAWIWVYGEIESGVIDHIDGCESNNRISNLRNISHKVNAQNQRRPQSNNKSGYLGVSWAKDMNKWQAQIMLNGKSYHLGYFEYPAVAHEAYLLKKREIHEGCVI